MATHPTTLRFLNPSTSANTLVEVRKLGREDFLIEIEAIAVAPA